MVKSGSFTVKQGSLAGRMGSNLGQSLAETVPKEVEQYRLRKGLENFQKNADNQSPSEQFTSLLSIPGINKMPQAIQQFPEILKQGKIRQAYQYPRNAGYPETNEGINVPESRIQPGTIGAQGRTIELPQKEREIAQPDQRDIPTIQETNPLRSEAIPRTPWSASRFDQEVGRVLEEGKAVTIPEAMAVAKDREARELAQPEAVQKQDAYYRDQQDIADKSFQNKLETKLQKRGEDLYKDITGEQLNNLKRSMYRDIRTAGPDQSIDTIADYWTDRALDYSKTKTKLSELQNKNFANKLTRSKENNEKLKSYQKIFAKTGNLEEYYKTLRSDFNLSPQAAAEIAYPLSNTINSFINKVSPTKSSEVSFIPSKSRKYATEIESLISREDSFLAIARKLRQKDPGFDQRSFFSQLREDQDSLSLSARQERELLEGESDYLKTWGDLLYFPFYGS